MARRPRRRGGAGWLILVGAMVGKASAGEPAPAVPVPVSPAGLTYEQESEPPPPAVVGPYTFNDPRASAVLGGLPFTRMPTPGEPTVRLGLTDVIVQAVGALEYVDNLNLSQSDPMADVIGSVTPRLYANRYLDEMHRASLQTGTRFSKYFDNGNLDTADPYFGGDLLFGLRNLSLALSDYFVRSSDPALTDFAADQPQVVRYNNSFTASAARQFGKFTGVAGYSRTDQNYDSEEYARLDSASNGAFARVGWPWTASRQAFLAYERVQRDYDSEIQPDYSSDDIRLGVQDQLTEHLSGQLNGGYLMRDYEGAAQGDKEALDDFVLGASLRHEIRESTVQTLRASKAPSDNPNANFFQRVTLGWQLTHLLRTDLPAYVGVNWTALDGSGQEDEQADIWAYIAGLSYPIARSTSLRLSYRYAMRESNIETHDYEQNRVTLAIGYTF